MATAKFSASTDYKIILNQLKSEFDKKWNEVKPSSTDKAKDFKDVTVLGSGAFGIVKLVKHKSSREFFAMKYLSKAKIVKHKQIAHTMNEKRILASINFPFLVSLECTFKDNTTLYIVMPFISGGELFSLLRKYHKFTEIQTRFYAAQIFLALEYLHHLNIIYRDLKPENILIDEQGYIKITDFGFCKICETRTYTLCGTPEYLAPEVILNKGYGKYVDWWSYGILVYEMLAGYSPFYTNNPDPMVLFDNIVSGKFKFPSHFGTDIKHLIHNLLQLDITKRYGNLKNGVNDIKNHAWFHSVNWIAMLNKEVEPQIVPKVSGAGDHSNFDDFPDEYIPKRTSKNLYEKEFADF